MQRRVLTSVLVPSGLTRTGKQIAGMLSGQALRWLFWCSREYPAYHEEFTSGHVLAPGCNEPVEDHSGITPRIQCCCLVEPAPRL